MTAQDKTTLETPDNLPWANPTFPRQALDAWFKSYSVWLDNANRLQAEAISFLSGRFERDVEVLKKFGNCRKPEDFVSLQSEFTSNLIAEYQQESAKIFGLFNDSLKTAFEQSVKTTEDKRRN